MPAKNNDEDEPTVIHDPRFTGKSREEIVDMIHKHEALPVREQLAKSMARKFGIRGGVETAVLAAFGYALWSGELEISRMNDDKPPEAALTVESDLEHVEEDIDEIRALIRKEIGDLSEDLEHDHQNLERLLHMLLERFPARPMRK